MTTTIRLAVTAADYAAVGRLMVEYVDNLPFELTFQDFDAELATLASTYGGDTGAALLVETDDGAVGVTAVSGFDGTVCELKRMYLQPQVRGGGIGRRLAAHAIAAAKRLGYTHMRLDTVDALQAAIALYRSIGFVEIAPYRHNPQHDARFFELDMTAYPRPDPVGVILTGGSSSRMGRDKAGTVLGGSTLLEHVAAAFSEAGISAATAGRDDDPPGMAGPLAGLVGAMRRHPGADIVLVATDQPYLRPATLLAMLDISRAIVVPVDERPQTTCAVYRDAAVPAVERFAAAHPQGSLQDVIAEQPTGHVGPDTWRSWGEDGRSWLSIDTPEELAAASETWPEPPR